MMDQLFGGGGAETQQEPLQQLLRQMTGGGGGLPGMEGVESMVNGMMAGGGAGGAIGPPPKRKDRWSIWWTLVHALGALLLSLWALSSNPHVFSGTQMARVESAALEKSEKPVITPPPQ